MKALENKTTGILGKQPIEGQPDVFATYADLIFTAVNSTGVREGLSPSEMRRRLRVLKAVEKSKDDVDNLILFEDHDADKLQEIMKQSKWPYIHESIMDLEDDIASMKYETEVREAAKLKKEEPKQEPVSTTASEPGSDNFPG